VVLGVFAFISHPWTFDQYFGIVVLLFGSLLVKLRGSLDDFRLRFVGFYVFCMLFVVFLRSVFFGGLGGVDAVGEVFVRITDFSSFWYHINVGSWFVYGGILANFVVLVLILYSFLVLDGGGISGYFMSLFVFVSWLVWVFGDSVIKDRLMYNAPLWLFCGYGLVHLLREGSFDRGRIVLVLFILMFQVCTCFRFLANIV
jgi:hypothetical protein